MFVFVSHDPLGEFAFYAVAVLHPYHPAAEPFLEERMTRIQLLILPVQ